MPRAPTAAGMVEKHTPWKLVIAVGVYTDHWGALVNAYPEILNCSMDVRDALGREWGESTYGSGMDENVRNRMKEKRTWKLLWEVALRIMERFGILLVVCNHGKHRSLSLAYEVAKYCNCELISPRDRTHAIRLSDTRQFLSYLAPRLEEHRTVYGGHIHPLVSVEVCTRNFDGPFWVISNDYTDTNDPRDLHVMAIGDIVLQMDTDIGDAAGWAYGSLLRGDECVPKLWYHPGAVKRMANWHYPKVENVGDSLKGLWLSVTVT
jgi:hypothetical protein